jgi:hypothetical protein
MGLALDFADTVTIDTVTSDIATMVGAATALTANRSTPAVPTSPRSTRSVLRQFAKLRSMNTRSSRVTAARTGVGIAAVPVGVSAGTTASSTDTLPWGDTATDTAKRAVTSDTHELHKAKEGETKLALFLLFEPAILRVGQPLSISRKTFPHRSRVGTAAASGSMSTSIANVLTDCKSSVIVNCAAPDDSLTADTMLSLTLRLVQPRTSSSRTETTSRGSRFVGL